MSKKNVLVLIPMDDEQRKALEKVSEECTFTYSSAKEVDRETVQKANVILGNPPADMVKDSPNIEFLQLNSAGTEPFIHEGALPKGTILTNATGGYGLAISEHMLATVLQLYKKLHLYRDNQNNSQWKDEGEVRSIWNSTTLIVGAGDIGCEFGKRMKALGSYTIGVKRTQSEKPEYLDELYTMEKLDELLPKADIVALSLPGTKETYKLFSKERMEIMKKEAVLINVGRGTAIDTGALCDLLESGHISGAALDVTDPEPLPSNHRLWVMKNAVITPHVSGFYHLKETHTRIVNIAINNLDAFLQGREMKNIVDFSTGYRKS